jgi:outer membrane protein TolC
MSDKSVDHEGHEGHEEGGAGQTAFPNFLRGFRDGHGSFVTVIAGATACALLVCAPVPARAQQAAAPQAAQAAAPIPVMEFDAVIAQAIAKNPTIARATTTIQRADALLQQSKAVILPVVSATVTNVTLDSARGFSGGVTQPQNQFSFAANASMSVLNTVRWAQVQQARDQVDVAVASAAEIQQQIVVTAAQTYLTVIAAHRQLAVSESALDNARAHLDYATKRLEGGAGSRLNQLRAAQVVSTETTRIEAIRLALRTAQEALGVVISADGPVDVGADPVFDMSGAFADDAWRTARPDLITQATIQRAAQRVVSDSWRDWMPTATASFDPAYVTPAGLFAPAGTWRFTLSATEQVFDGGQRKIALRQREITLDQARINLSAAELRARSEVRLAQEAVRAAERAAESARLAAQQTSEVLTITTTAFEVGATTNLEVIDAQRSDLDAKTTAELAEGAVRRARLDLLVALGRFK